MKPLLGTILLALGLRLAAFENLDFEETQGSGLFTMPIVPGWQHIGANSGDGTFWNVNYANLGGWAEATVIDSAASFSSRPSISGRFSMGFSDAWPTSATRRSFFGPNEPLDPATEFESIGRAFIAQTGTVSLNSQWLTLLTDYSGPTASGTLLSIYFNDTPVPYSLEEVLPAGSYLHLNRLTADLSPFVGHTAELRIGIEGPPTGSFDSSYPTFVIDNITFVPEARFPLVLATAFGLVLGGGVLGLRRVGNQPRP